jgi:hypothetical protein
MYAITEIQVCYNRQHDFGDRWNWIYWQQGG